MARRLIRACNLHIRKSLFIISTSFHSGTQQCRSHAERRVVYGQKLLIGAYRQAYHRPFWGRPFPIVSDRFYCTGDCTYSISLNRRFQDLEAAATLLWYQGLSSTTSFDEVRVTERDKALSALRAWDWIRWLNYGRWINRIILEQNWKSHWPFTYMIQCIRF